MKRIILCGIIITALLLAGCNKTLNPAGVQPATQPGSASESTQPDTQKATQPQTEAPETEPPETEPQPSVEVRNGHTICPVCSAVYPADEKCWHCTSGTELGERCPYCGGYSGITERSHTSCNYCQTTLCSLVLQEGEQYADVHCADCGVCQLTAGLLSRAMYGKAVCESCHFQSFSMITREEWENMTRYEPGKYTICSICTAVYLTDSHCWNCANERAGLGVVCPHCGGGLGITDVRHAVCAYCGAVVCSFSHCRGCGICQLYRGLNWDGLCNDCAG